MEDAKIAPSDESWRIETRGERLERRRRYAREAWQDSAWLVLTAFLLIACGVGGALVGLVLGASWALCLLLFVPVGLLRLLSTFVSASDPSAAWDLRRALYAHPFVKFVALLILLGPVLAPFIAAHEKSQGNAEAQVTPQSRAAPQAGSQDGRSGTDEPSGKVGSLGLLLVCVALWLGSGLTLLIISFSSLGREVPW